MRKSHRREQLALSGHCQNDERAAGRSSRKLAAETARVPRPWTCARRRGRRTLLCDLQPPTLHLGGSFLFFGGIPAKRNDTPRAGRKETRAQAVRTATTKGDTE